MTQRNPQFVCGITPAARGGVGGNPQRTRDLLEGHAQAVDVVPHPEQGGAGIPPARHPIGSTPEFRKHLLHKIRRVHLATGQLQEEGIERIGMRVVELFESGGMHSFCRRDARRCRFCLMIED